MPEPDALLAAKGASARPWIALAGVCARDLAAIDKALYMLGLSPCTTTISPRAPGALETGWWQPRPGARWPSRERWPAREPAAAVVVLSSPLEAVADLAGHGGCEPPLAVAIWERYNRMALSNLRGLPVFVTSRSNAAADPAAWADVVGSFLSAHGAPPLGHGSRARLGKLLGAGQANDEALKDEGLLLESQRQLASLLDQLVGPHDRFEPPAPEPESAWVTAMLEARRDLEQVWKGLDWATKQLAAFVAARPLGPADSAELYPLNASEDLAAYHRWLERRGEACSRQLSGGLPVASARVRAKRRPLFSVVVPVLRPPPWALERCVASVLAQSYPEFQLVLADDASGDGALLDQLRSYSRLDPRVDLVVRTETGGISAATNSAIEKARGEHLVFLDHDDELHPEALAKMAEAVAANPEADVFYSDEDKLSPAGERCVPSLKPDWSPDLLLSSAYFCHMLVVRRSLVVDLGGLRPAFDGSQDYDLMLRATEVARAVVHVPEILYHWRVLTGSTSADLHAKPWAFAAERRALEEALARRGIEAVVEPHPRYAGNFNVRRAVVGEPLVSVVIPFRDEPAMTAACYRSLVAAPGYENYELVFVDNASELPETEMLIGELAEDPKVKVLHDPRPFDWVAINNAAAAKARGEVLLFMNNDIEARSDGWLAAMLGHAQRQEVGAVGALLRYPDRTIQHAGIVLAMSWGAAHVQQGLPESRASYMLIAELTRNCSAVTGACLMTRRSCFEDLGGFDPALPVAFSDVDYCLRLGKKGLRVVYEPLAELIHFESKSRGHADDVVETPVFRDRWRDELLAGDPYHNCHLTRFDPYCRLSTVEETGLWNKFRSMLEASSTN